MLTLVHKGFLGRDPACQAQAQLWWRVIKWLRSYLQGDDSPAIPPDSMTSG